MMPQIGPLPPWKSRKSPERGLSPWDSELLLDERGDATTEALALLRVLVLDHHAHQRPGARGPQHDAPGAVRGEPLALVLDDVPDRPAAGQPAAVGAHVDQLLGEA